MYKVFLSNRAEKNLKLLDKKTKADIRDAIDNFIHTYFPKKYDIRKLKGLEYTYRLRIGNERIREKRGQAPVFRLFLPLWVSMGCTM